MPTRHSISSFIFSGWICFQNSQFFQIFQIFQDFTCSLFSDNFFVKISHLPFLSCPFRRVQAGMSWPTKPRPCLCGSSTCQPPKPPSCSMKSCSNPETIVRYSSKIRGWTATCSVSDPHKSIWANGRWLGDGCGRGLSKARNWQGLACGLTSLAK